MLSYSKIAHRQMSVCSPVPWMKYERLFSANPWPAEATILDIGCGKCGILAELIQMSRGTGVGVDLPGSLATELTTQARDLEKEHRLRLVLADANDYIKNSIEKFDAVACIGSSQALGGIKNLLDSSLALLNKDGALLVGELVWKAKPAKGLLDFLECAENDIPYADELRSLSMIKYDLVGSVSCSDSDFENYELALRESILQWCAENIQNEKSSEFRERANTWWDARDKWARAAFGFEALLLRPKS